MILSKPELYPPIPQHPKRRTSSKSDDAFDRKYKAAVKAYHNYMEGLNLVLKEKGKDEKRNKCPSVTYIFIICSFYRGENVQNPT